MRATLTPVVLAALLLLPACGGGGGASLPTRPSVTGPFVQGAKGVWIFTPAGEQKRLVIFFHGQGGPVEATPANHRAWIDHLVQHGAVVVYPRYEEDNSAAVLEPAVAGIRTASGRLGLKTTVPVLALGTPAGPRSPSSTQPSRTPRACRCRTRSRPSTRFPTASRRGS